MLRVRYEEYQFFASKFFCLTVSNTFVVEPFNVSENFGHRRVLRIKRRNHFFPLQRFCLTVPKTLVEEPFCVSNKSGSENFDAYEGGGDHRFVENFLCQRTEKLPKGHFCVSETFWYEKNMDKIWGYHVFPSNIFCPTVPKKFLGEPFNLAETFWYRDVL